MSFCPPLALKLRERKDRRGSLVLWEKGLNVSQHYSGMDSGAGLEMGHSELR